MPFKRIHALSSQERNGIYEKSILQQQKTSLGCKFLCTCLIDEKSICSAPSIVLSTQDHLFFLLMAFSKLIIHPCTVLFCLYLPILQKVSWSASYCAMHFTIWLSTSTHIFLTTLNLLHDWHDWRGVPCFPSGLCSPTSYSASTLCQMKLL